MTTALKGGEWSAVHPGRTLPLGKTRYPLYRRLGGPQGRSGRAENLAPPGFDPWTVQPVVSHYTDWATRPTIHTVWSLNITQMIKYIKGSGAQGMHRTEESWIQSFNQKSWRSETRNQLEVTGVGEGIISHTASGRTHTAYFPAGRSVQTSFTLLTLLWNYSKQSELQTASSNKSQINK